ncbi:hypothetical protein EU538_06885, partial [Candidatus Thorarchaeota archaeon]
MRVNQIPVMAMIVLSLILGFSAWTYAGLQSEMSDEGTDEPGGATASGSSHHRINEGFVLSEGPATGIMNPATILQSGFQAINPAKGRTDSPGASAQNVSIDEANGWFANRTEVEVSQLRRLYAVNGTFDAGPDPWTSYSYNAGSDTQIPSYNYSAGHVVCRNIGYYSPAHEGHYVHSEGTEIGWQQAVTNTPSAQDFRLEFEFQYHTGPLDPEGDDPFTGDIAVFWELESNSGFYEGWYSSIQTLSSRNTWYSIAEDYTLPAPHSELTVRVGLYITTGDFEVYPERDYDDDGLPDGVENARNVTLFIDNIEFVSSETLSFQEVDLTFHAGLQSASILGTETGTASISNPDYWTTGPLEVEITANTSVVFTYTLSTLFHRQINSSWTTNLGKEGVKYSVTSGQKPEYTFYVYVTQPTGYLNPTIDLYFPKGWLNMTVWDPLADNITDVCDVYPGRIHVPTDELSRSGWWKIDFIGFNYAKSVSVQVQDETGEWYDETIFRPGNQTRVQVEIGSGTSIPLGGDPVNISWISTVGAVWTLDSVASLVEGKANSSSWTLGGSNTTAGEWLAEVLWTNGTEVAYETVSFSIYHSAAIAAIYETIEADHGQIISNLITLKDADTNEYLMDDSVTIEANWSGSSVLFTQNYAKNWWEADFDTSLVEGGEHLVIVTASRPYFDAVTTQFMVKSMHLTTLEISNAGSLPIENGLGEVFTLEIQYEFLNGTGIVGAEPLIAYSGPSDGLSWKGFLDNNDGSYTVDFVANISGTYEVTVSLTKPYHHNMTDAFVLIIGATGSELEFINGTSDVIAFGESYRLVVEYRNSTGAGLAGADIEVVTVTPDIGIAYDNFSHVMDGLYEIVVTPLSAGTFSLFISASAVNHETQFATFTVTATKTSTYLALLPSSGSTPVDQPFTVQLWFQDESFNGIDSAVLIVIDPPAGVSLSSFDPVGNGRYNITLTPVEIGAYDLLFRASAENYQSSSATFTLVVTEIQTSMDFEGDLSGSADFAKPYNLTVYYLRPDTHVFVSGANLSVDVSDPSALNISVVELGDRYVLTITGRKLGTFSLSVIATKPDHRVAVKQFLFEVLEIGTYVDGVGPLTALLVGRPYSFNFSYCQEYNGSSIIGANTSASGAGASWVSFAVMPRGVYSVHVSPGEIGDHSVLLQFEKPGFSSATFRLSFRVERVPLTVTVNEGLTGFEDTSVNLVIGVTESDTDETVSGLSVFFSIWSGEIRLAGPTIMTDISSAGFYSAQVLMPSADGSYTIRIQINGGEFYETTAYEAILVPERTLSTLLIVTVRQYYWAILAVGLVAVYVTARRSLRKKKIRENKEALAVKKRFDGIKSLLGVIVLHKESGIPIYSRILRQGLDEAIISAFITAITNFRREFDIEDSSEEWSLVPISDIVRIVSTEKLFCAFITVGRPSEDYRERMIQFAKTVGFMFDATLGDAPIAILDTHTKHE